VAEVELLPAPGVEAMFNNIYAPQGAQS